MRSTVNPMIVAVIGIVLCLLAVGGLTYFLVMPTQQTANEYEQRYETAFPDSTLPQQQAAQKDLVKAKQEVAQTQAQWAVIENTLMPPFDVSQRYTAWKQLSNELSYNLGPSLQHWMEQGGSGGATPLTNVSLPAPPANPNAVTAAPLVIPISGSSSGGGGRGGLGGGGGMGGYPGGGGGGGGGGNGSISVGGSFRQILKHVQLWNDYRRLVLVDNLSLHGNSPYMTGNYGATVIIFPQNDTKVAQPIPAASAGTANGPGGYPGAMGG